MYQIDRNEELTTDRLGKILMDFQTTKLPELQKYYNYYNITPNWNSNIYC